MYYRHDMDYVYPAQSDQHMIDVRHLRDVDLNEDYPYLQKSWGYKLRRAGLWLLCNGFIFFLLRITHGLRIHGKKNLKAYKKEMKDGVITVSNHVFMWDFLCVMKVMRPRLGFFPAWKINLEGSNGPLIRLAGGIPIPTGNLKCMKKFKGAMAEVFEKKRWMHFYPEGSLWFFYPDIRPLKKAVFHYAVQYDRPVIPLVFTFRPRKNITRLFTRKPLVDLIVGEPMRHDPTLSRAAATADLQARVYHVMQGMAGVHPGDPTYNENLDTTTYQKTMG